MKKIKIAMVTKHFEATGISTVILNYCKALDKNKYDLSVISGVPIAQENKEECEKCGIDLISLPARHGEPLKHYFGLWKALKEKKYDIVHIHGSSSMMAIELIIAKLAGIKIRIAHCHSTSSSYMKIQNRLNPLLRRMNTKAIACGKMAGEWIFGKNQFEILPNAFHTEIFRYNCDDRRRIREELHIEKSFVIGHIGRFNEPKNQSYLLKVFKKVAEKREDAVLLLVGTGPDFERIQEVVKNHPHKDRIILYGETSNTSAMYSAMDIFVFPSRYEGLPVVLLEAQTSGLPCIASDRVTKEVDFGDIIWESIDQSPDVWAGHILNLRPVRDVDRYNYFLTKQEKRKEYDIDNTVNQLERIYSELLN